MERNVDLKEITDGRLYRTGEMVKADCMGCEGCHQCCQGMGNSIILDPLDVHRLCSYFRVPFEALLANHISLNVVDGIILPNMNMRGEEERCIFLNEEGRCGIHKIRPGFCRLFPLARVYNDNRTFNYVILNECPKKDKQKVKIEKWMDVGSIKTYEKFVNDWHWFLKDVARHLEKEQASEKTVKDVNIYILKQFYMRGFEVGIDFYAQFEERLKETRYVLLRR